MASFITLVLHSWCFFIIILHQNRCTALEEDCDKLHSWLCHDGTCVNLVFRCDGYEQCPDSSDELDCGGNLTKHVNCSADQFMCDNSCIAGSLVCNGEEDCFDYTDEINCGEKTKHCENFLCNNGHCIIEEWVCDGVDDCKDNSDEMHCEISPNSTCDINDGLYSCNDKSYCLPIDRVCNDKNDCKDGSDEGGQCEFGKQNCAKAKCNHGCLYTPAGATCVCNQGFGKVDNSTCVDIDECHLFHDHCSHYCENHPGYYTCSCAPGFQLLDDKRSCIATGESPVIVFSNGTSIFMYNIRKKKYVSIVDHIDQAIGVAYDGDYIYWTTTTLSGFESISRLRLNDSDQKVIVKTGLKDVENIAIDWYTKNLYFTDSKKKHIGVCTNDGIHCTVLINRNMDKPRAIVLNPTQGEMYWTDWGRNPEIAKALMDGSDDKSIVTINIFWPNGLTMDYPNDRLYWVDGKHNWIESVRPDGSHRVRVLNNIHHPFSIAVFENNLYWSNWGTNSLETCDKFTGKNIHMLVHSNKCFGLHVYHPSLMEKKDHACEHNECEYMCLLKGKNDFVCSCPEGKMLNGDGKTCKHIFSDEYLIIGANNMVLTIHHQILGGHTVTSKELPISNIDALVYDSEKDRIIVYDDNVKTIYSIGKFMQNDFDIRILVNSGIGRLTGMDLDYVTRNLYWCDPIRKTLEIFSLDSGNHTVLIHNLNGNLIINIALIPDIGVMFFVLHTLNGHYILTKASMDGIGPLYYIEHQFSGTEIKMHYDHTTGLLFIADSGCECIHVRHVQGNQMRTLNETISNIGSLTSLSKEIFWSPKNSKELFWKEKYYEHESIKRNKIDIPGFVSQMILTTAAYYPRIKTHMCRTGDNKCSHMCLQSQISSDMHYFENNEVSHMPSYTCACPRGMILEPNGKTCKTEVVCENNQFKCRKSNVCIDLSRHCDKETDCIYGEDEEECIDKKEKCADCKNSDCFNENCTTIDHKSVCQFNQFECSSGQCLEMISKCDGVNDCPDRDDEKDCFGVTCSSDFFQCEIGNCIPKHWKCDSEIDCADGSDENEECEYKKGCNPNMFHCQSGRCINMTLHCNNMDDCGDQSDEINCPTPYDISLEVKECDDFFFMCGYNTEVCVPYDAKCNGTKECPDGMDEKFCDRDVGECPQDSWQCRDKTRCIPRVWICDKNNDCLDGSDENKTLCNNIKGNSLSKTIVENSLLTFDKCQDKYTCAKEGQCIDYNFLCDGNWDCLDGSDEGGSCDSSCNQHICSEKCFKSPQGSICGCEENRVLATDGHKCIPKPSACSKNPSPCHHLCIDNNSTFVCNCFEGYTLRSDRRRCKAVGSAKSFIYITNTDIRKLSHDLVADILHSEDTSELTGIDINIKKQSIYFSTEKLGQIHLFNYITKKKSTVLQIGKPTLIAIDWITENIYFVNNDVNKNIMVCHIDDKKCAKILYLDKEALVNAFVIDPINGFMFYSLTRYIYDGKSKSIIYKAHLDGTNVVEMIKDDLNLCKGLAIDYEKKILYFSDEDTNKLSSINYEVSNRKNIADNSVYFKNPISLDVFEDKMYFIHNGSSKMITCTLFGEFMCFSTNLYINNTQIIKIQQESKQKNAYNNCSSKNCSHICVQSRSGATCLCDNGEKVDENKECLIDKSNPEIFRENLLKTNDKAKPSRTGVTWLIIIVMTCFLILATIVLYKHQKKRLERASDLDFSVHFQNPGFGRGISNFALGLGNITSRFTNFVKPDRSEFSNPLTTKTVSNDWPPNALDPKSLQLKQKISGCRLEVPNLLGDSDSDVESDRDLHDMEHRERARLIP